MIHFKLLYSLKRDKPVLNYKEEPVDIWRAIKLTVNVCLIRVNCFIRAPRHCVSQSITLCTLLLRTPPDNADLFFNLLCLLMSQNTNSRYMTMVQMICCTTWTMEATLSIDLIVSFLYKIQTHKANTDSKTHINSTLIQFYYTLMTKSYANI